MKRIAAVLVCVLTLVCSGALADDFFTFTDDDEDAAPQEAEASIVFEAVVFESETAEAVWEYPISLDILADPQDLLVLTNKENLLDDSYPPQDEEMYKLMETTVKKTKNIEMPVRKVTNDALETMFAAAEAEGAKLLAHSAYRSHYRQAVMYENRLKSIGHDDGVVQMPGASEHQTGLAVDIINAAWAKESRLNSKFATTTEGQWMAENCHKYGFIIRYPEDKEDVTGIIYEAWHLRYVGVEVATYMKESNLCLEEFTAEYRHKLAEYTLNGGEL